MDKSVEPEISVLMAVYNGQRFLKEAIDSILSQTWQDFEFIIVNDGSTDISEEIILSYDDARIVYVKNLQNLGLIASLNKGISVAGGNFIARMDQDDIALPERFTEQLQLFISKPDAVVVGSDYYQLRNNKLSPVRNENNSAYLKTLLLFSPCFAHPTVMIKNVFKKHSLAYDKAFVHAEDYKLWTVLAHYGEFYNVNKALLKYRTHPAQTSTTHRETQLRLSAKIRKQYLTDMGFKFSEQQFEVHSTIANNLVIRSVDTLKKIEAWLLELTRQESTLKALDETGFKKAIHKFWMDSCGYTGLGMAAYKIYNYSQIARMAPVSFKNRIALMVKCLIRKYTFS